MRNVKVLELLNEGRIDELKQALRDEIYAEALSENKPPGAKKRYAAMKKYFTYIKTGRDILQHPCMVEFEGKMHTSFCNAHSLALTTEPCGTMQLCTEPERYPDVTRLIKYEGYEKEIDLERVFAEAKSLGYKLKKSELSFDRYKYLMHFEGSYYKLGLLDATLSIIDDGGYYVVWHLPGKRSAITIKTEIGVCTVMPINIENDSFIEEHNIIVIEA